MSQDNELSEEHREVTGFFTLKLNGTTEDR